MPLDDAKSADEFVFSDPAVWKFAQGRERQGFLELAYDRKKYKSTYTPKHRSPIHIALLEAVPAHRLRHGLSSCMSTTEPYGHQDLCLFFGFESPEKYYYVHIAQGRGHERPQRVHRQRRAAEEHRQGDDEGRRVEEGHVAQGPARAAGEARARSRCTSTT